MTNAEELTFKLWELDIITLGEAREWLGLSDPLPKREDLFYSQIHSNAGLHL